MQTPSAPAKRKRKTEVPQQFLGFSLQEFLFLEHLLEARGETTVCLEVFSDTGTRGPDGVTLAQESKSVTSSRNPLTNRASDLWKTLANWSVAASRKELDIDRTIFRLRVSRKRQPGTIAQHFMNAGDRTGAMAALEAARAEFDGLKPGALPESIQEYVTAFFASSTEIQVAIVLNFSIEFGTGSAFDDLKRKVIDAKKWVSEEKLDDILHYLLGWIKAQIASRLEKLQPAMISLADFDRVARSTARQFDRDTILLSRAQEPSIERKEQELTRTFVRQLDLIGLDYDRKLRAINDYLCAEFDRLEWGIRGEVHQTSFDNFEMDLVSAWENLKLRCSTLYRDRSETDRGVLLYTDCCAHRTRLSGIDPPPHFCPGSYHLLSDKRTVGWHPQYPDLLDSE